MGTEDESFASEGDLGETEAVNPPHRDDDPPKGGFAMPAAWLIVIGLLILTTLGFLVGWAAGLMDLPG